jgi:CDGSH-type Zn-finger protein
MVTVLGFSEDFTVCDRCGKSELKGTWAIENEDGDLFRLGSSCIHKKFEFSSEEAKALIAEFKKAEKFKALYAEHIAPLYTQMTERLNSTFTVAFCQLPEHGKKIWNQIESDYKRAIEYRMKKYKIMGA